MIAYCYNFSLFSSKIFGTSVSEHWIRAISTLREIQRGYEQREINISKEKDREKERKKKDREGEKERERKREGERKKEG